jgi:hypothetical protein
MAVPTADESGRPKRLLVGVTLVIIVVVAAAVAVIVVSDGDDDPADFVAGAAVTESSATAPPSTNGQQAGGDADRGADRQGDEEAGSTTSATPSPTQESRELSASDSCRFARLDSFDDVQVEVVYTSTFGSTVDLMIDYALRDRDGVRIMTGNESVERVAPGETVLVESDTFTDAPAGLKLAATSCEILDVDEITFGDPLEPAGPEDTCTYLGVDSFDDMQLQVTFVSPFSQRTDIFVKTVVRDGDGVRRLTASALVETVLPGETVRVDVDTVNDRPAGVGDDELSCEVLGFEAWDF